MNTEQIQHREFALSIIYNCISSLLVSKPAVMVVVYHDFVRGVLLTTVVMCMVQTGIYVLHV
jgi:hypothetical protein